MNCAIENGRPQQGAEHLPAMKRTIVAFSRAYAFNRCSARCQVRQLLAHPSNETEDGAIASNDGRAFRSARLRLLGGSLSTLCKA
eukprot:8787860-Pyramimonas_sp.AAC.1